MPTKFQLSRSLISGFSRAWLLKHSQSIVGIHFRLQKALRQTHARQRNDFHFRLSGRGSFSENLVASNGESSWTENFGGRCILPPFDWTASIAAIKSIRATACRFKAFPAIASKTAISASSNLKLTRVVCMCYLPQLACRESKRRKAKGWCWLHHLLFITLVANDNKPDTLQFKVCR